MTYKICFYFVAALACAPALAVETATAQEGAVLYRKTYGQWTVLCARDVMNDAKTGCVLQSKAEGPSRAAQDKMLLETWAEDKSRIGIRVVTPLMLKLSDGLMFRSDSDPPLTIACARIEKQNTCEIPGSDRDALLASWEMARHLVIRAFTFEGEAKDYRFDTIDFSQGFQDFKLAVEKYL